MNQIWTTQVSLHYADAYEYQNIMGPLVKLEVIAFIAELNCIVEWHELSCGLALFDAM